MSDLIRTTGRPMTRALQEALDSVPRRERATTIRALSESDGPLSGLLTALALELGLCALRDQDDFMAFERDLHAWEADDPSGLPRATGGPVFFDPETGEFRDLPGQP